MDLIQIVQAVASVTLHAMVSAIAVITLNTPALHPQVVSYISTACIKNIHVGLCNVEHCKYYIKPTKKSITCFCMHTYTRTHYTHTHSQAHLHTYTYTYTHTSTKFEVHVSNYNNNYYIINIIL